MGPRDRRSWAWRRHRRALLDQARATGQTDCARCGWPVDLDLSGRHPWGPTADHITPLALGGALTGPVRLMHNRCNGAGGTAIRRLSRRWTAPTPEEEAARAHEAFLARMAECKPSRDW